MRRKLDFIQISKSLVCYDPKLEEIRVAKGVEDCWWWLLMALIGDNFEKLVQAWRVGSAGCFLSKSLASFFCFQMSAHHFVEFLMMTLIHCQNRKIFLFTWLFFFFNFTISVFFFNFDIFVFLIKLFYWNISLKAKKISLQPSDAVAVFTFIVAFLFDQHSYAVSFHHLQSFLRVSGFVQNRRSCISTRVLKQHLQMTRGKNY